MPKINLNISWEQVGAGNTSRIDKLFCPPIDNILSRVGNQVVFSLPAIHSQNDVERFSLYAFVISRWIFLPWAISLENNAYLTILKCSAVNYRFVQYPTHCVHLPDADEWEDLVEAQIDTLKEYTHLHLPRALIKDRQARLIEYLKLE